MTILLTGSTGLLGSALKRRLPAAGHKVLCLVRHTPKAADEIHWDTETGQAETPEINTVDAVIHLAGENIAAKKWSADQKQRIRDSRVKYTTQLVECLMRLKTKPRVFISASAVGYYGECGDKLVTDQSGPGTGFLAEVCREWEAASKPLAAAGTRVVCLRFGMILSAAGGALAKMRPLFSYGLGGKLGSGKQWWSWLTLEDALGIILHGLTTESLSGSVNAVSPHPVTNAGFTQCLAAAMGRPAILPVPAFALRFMMGEMADELLLASVKATPRALLLSGYQFQYPDLMSALKFSLARTAQTS